MLGWLVDERGIEPHVKVFDKSERTDGTFSRSDFAYEAEARPLRMPWRQGVTNVPPQLLQAPRRGVEGRQDRLRASRLDCDACALKSKCCPNDVARKIARSIHEAARDKARAIAKTEAYAVSRRERKRSRCCSLI